MNLFKLSKQPSELNKVLLLIATQLPILSLMYLQNVNPLLLFMLFCIAVSQAFNISTLRAINKTHDMLIEDTHDIIQINTENIRAINILQRKQLRLEQELKELKS